MNDVDLFKMIRFPVHSMDMALNIPSEQAEHLAKRKPRTTGAVQGWTSCEALVFRPSQ